MENVKPARRKRKRASTATIGVVLVVVFVGAGLLSLVWVYKDPFLPNFMALRQGPSLTNPLGTDNLGRDMLSRMMVGARITLTISLLSCAVATLIGTFLGLLSGYFGGLLDRVSTVITDVSLAFPYLLLAVTVVGALGPGTLSVVLALSIWLTPAYIRLVRATTMAVRNRDFVHAAVALGAGDMRIVASHVLPNVLAPIIVLTTLNLARAILAEAGLSFLGIGVQPPAPSWGTMIAQGREYLRASPHMAVVPGLAVAGLVIGFNLLGDAMRDALDPKAKKSFK